YVGFTLGVLSLLTPTLLRLALLLCMLLTAALWFLQKRNPRQEGVGEDTGLKPRSTVTKPACAGSDPSATPSQNGQNSTPRSAREGGLGKRRTGLHPRLTTPSVVDEGLPAWALLLLCVGGVFLFCALILCLGPIVDYDGLAYHVAAPKRWLELGGMRFLPTQ